MFPSRALRLLIFNDSYVNIKILPTSPALKSNGETSRYSSYLKKFLPTIRTGDVSTCAKLIFTQSNIRTYTRHIIPENNLFTPQKYTNQ